MPKRLNPIAQYLLYLVGTLAAYGVYATTVVPKIETNESVAEREFTPRTVTNRTDRKQKFAHLFPVDSWEMGPCKVLETAQGTVLFKDYQPYDDGHVDVEPFTMIIRDKEKDPSAAPIVLRSSEKAVLKFERAFQLNGGDPGKIQQGALAGQVSIYRPPSADGENDFLKILTSNVQLEKHKIYTVDDVEFEFGNSHGRGRNLAIELAHHTPLDAINTDFSKISGVRKLKLGFLQRIRFQAPAKKSKGDRILAGQNAPLEIRCEGTFGFDFERQTADFKDNVVVRQLDDSGQSLECEQLTLVFDTAIEDGEQPMVYSKTDELADKDFRLRKVVAVGSPVRLIAKNKDATVRAEYLNYDLGLNTINARSEKGVLFQMGNQQFSGQDIQYRIREDGAIGPLLANGPGTMRRIDEDKGFAASWTESLTIQPDQPGEKLVIFRGKSSLTLNEQTEITGNEMRVRLWEIPKAKTPAALPDDPTDPDQTSWEYLPHQLESQGNVSITSPQLSGTMQSLVARWPKPGSPIQLSSTYRVNRPVYVQEPFEAQTHLTAITSRQTQPSVQTANWQNETTSTPIQGQLIQQVNFAQDLATTQTPPNPMAFTAETVEVDFASHQRDTEISQLVLEGQVVVRETSRDDPNAVQLEIAGEQVFLIPQGKDVYRLNVAGNAKVIGKGLTLSGPDIHLDQNANRLWVVGAGSMSIEQPNEQNGEILNAAHAADDITINWQGGMIFDGRKMYFEDEVAAVGMQHNQDTKSQVRSLSAGLSVMLSQEINFKQLSGNGQHGMGEIDIREMILVDRLTKEKRVFDDPSAGNPKATHSPVVFEKIDLDSRGQIAAKQKMIVPHASVDMTNGNVRASGPGTLMNWQVGKLDATGGMFRQASADLGAQPASAKSFLRINFDRLLVADGENDHVHIDGKVRTLYAPVDNFEQQFNPDNATRPAGAIRLTCERMEMARWQPRGTTTKTNELSAQGNARIVGDQFDATADRLNYSEVKDLLTLEGSNRTAANLSFSDPKASSQRNLVAGKILYRPSDGWTEIQKVQEASMNQSGSMFNNR